MRVIALIATYNERRFLKTCLDHLQRQGVGFYILDNESSDDTVAQIRTFTGNGLVGLETFPRLGRYRWEQMLRRKEQLAAELDADWFIHLDPDEIRLPPAWSSTLADAFAEVDRRGFNAVNFMEYVFLPTRESPDHDHAQFQETMRWYYPFEPQPSFRLTAWRKQKQPVDLATSAGHTVNFPGLRVFPEAFPMRHYLFLSREHAAEKYGRIAYDPLEVARGWHDWRAVSSGTSFDLPSQRDLCEHTSDKAFEPANPRTAHIFVPHIPTATANVRGPEWRIEKVGAETRDGISRVEIALGGEPLWFSSADAELVPSAEAVAGLCLLPALETGATIRLESPVDSKWLAGIERVISVYREWWNYPGRNPVIADALADTPPLSTGTAAFFTCGVDSFYSLLHGQHPIDTLVFVRGFDMPLEDHVRFEALRRSLESVREQTRKKIIVVSTNLKTHPIAGKPHWQRMHGPALVAIAHLLRRQAGTFVIASSDTADPHDPWGSHWRLDPNFSTTAVKIIHGEPQTRRCQKVSAIAREPLVHRHLRVCWENRTPSGNCSSCEKCLRTMLDLCAAGALQNVQTFDHTTPLAARLDALPSIHPHVVALWKNSLTQPLPPEIRAAAERLLARSPAGQTPPPPPS